MDFVILKISLATSLNKNLVTLLIHLDFRLASKDNEVVDSCVCIWEEYNFKIICWFSQILKLSKSIQLKYFHLFSRHFFHNFQLTVDLINSGQCYFMIAERLNELYVYFELINKRCSQTISSLMKSIFSVRHKQC